MSEYRRRPGPMYSYDHLGYRHIRIHPHCGACGFRFRQDDKIVALLDEDDGVVRAGVFSGAFRAQNVHILRRQKSCPLNPCSGCAAPPESATVHVDCLKACHHARGTRRLWRAATWRHPWRGAPSLDLLPALDASDIMRRAPDSFGLGRFASLPPELTRMIYDCSKESELWRLQSAWNFGHALSQLEADHPQSVPLDSIESWDRDEGLQTTCDTLCGEITNCTGPKRLVRITIDAEGLQRIERLDVEAMRLTASYGRYLAYVVEDPTVLSGVQVEFRLGRARLRLPENFPGLRVWDLSFPPSLWGCRVDPTPRVASSRLRTISLRDCTGITFFVAGEAALAIHGHTRQEPHAEATFQGLAPMRQRVVTWIYIPLPHGVETLWWRVSDPDSVFSPIYFVIRARMPAWPEEQTRGDLFEEDVEVGTTDASRLDGAALVEQPLALTYMSPLPGVCPISSFWAYSDTSEASGIAPCVTPRPLANVRFWKPPFSRSSASLGGVDTLVIFRDVDSGVCRGILLRYCSGSERSLGQCRLGRDVPQVVNNPTQLCYLPLGIVGHPVACRPKVSAATTEAHDHEGSGWVCFAMRGPLVCLFSFDTFELGRPPGFKF